MKIYPWTHIAWYCAACQAEGCVEVRLKSERRKIEIKIAADHDDRSECECKFKSIKYLVFDKSYRVESLKRN